MAARTWAKTQWLRVTRASSARLRLLQAGVIERKSPGAGERSGTYHASPNPSPLRGSSDSAAWVDWRMREWAGSVTRLATVMGSP